VTARYSEINSGQSDRLAIQPTLLDNTVSKMGDARSLNHAADLQFDRLDTQVLEEADAPAQQDGHEVDRDLVEQSGLETLPRNIRAADAHTLIPGDLLRFRDGALDAIGDDGKR
jgi:hypothetical protein